MFEIAENKSKKILLLLLKKNFVNLRFTEKFEAFYNKITSMQIRITKLKVRRDAKFTVLTQHWDNTLKWLTKKGEDLGN